MRYIDIAEVISTAPKSVLAVLSRADKKIQLLSESEKSTFAEKGNLHWKQIKAHLESVSNRKCWYTESENPGCINDVEHYRPKAKIVDNMGITKHWYWYLAFNPVNYRLSCIMPNRLNSNPLLGETGGKGDQFPLLAPSTHAASVAQIVNELPVILDPCNRTDTEMLAFSPDGRPVLSPGFRNDAVAGYRLEKSKLLLNLDYPTFNVGRERIYNKVVKYVSRGDGHFLNGSPSLEDVKEDLLELMSPDAEYSKAAECYIRCFRDRGWVDSLFT